MKRFSIIFALVLILIAVSESTYAQQPSPGDMCQNKINNDLAKELRHYRAILFGVKLAVDAPIGDIRYLKSDGKPWIKKVDGEWTDAKGNTKENQEIDNESETSVLLQTQNGNKTGRPGIFETKRVLTSTLIPYLLQNIRALDCNTQRICMQAQFSLTQTGASAIPMPELQPPGCIKFPNAESIKECHLANKELNDQASVLAYCNDVAKQMMVRESALLKLAVEYDAGYRSTLQFAGVFDSFLEEIRWTFTGSMRQAASLIGQLNRIPCFLSSCDAAPDAGQ